MATVINGRQYEFADVTLILGGRDVVGLRGISYIEKQNKEVIYGKGNKPLAIQKGNFNYEGSVTLLQSEVETLRVLAKSQSGRASLMNLALDAVVCYGDPLKGDVMVTDRINSLQFIEDPKEMNQADGSMEIELPFIALSIDYQI